MCGIIGLIRSRSGNGEIRHAVTAMGERLKHRGPDDHGTYFDDEGSAGFGHARLSILDLSPAGHQPMESSDGRYIIVFNGEIYNFWSLRRDLESFGHTFHSRSDTEVILQLFQRYGPSCVEKLEGMFAFAIWDSVDRKCFLARDPLGIKPLYVWNQNGCIAFASEFRAVLEANLGARKLNSIALQGYLLFGSVQEPETLVDNISMLPAGHWMDWQNGNSTLHSYWKIHLKPIVDDTVATNHKESDSSPRRSITKPHAIELTRSALIESVKKHFVSDVPVCLFLSGGIDSTALLGLSQVCGFEKLRTFSISFDDTELNEGHLASRTSNHFQSEHHDWRMTDVDGRHLIGDFLNAMDQPSNDGFNTYCVSKLAHDNGAKVVLSGLGGDEIFGGYPSFWQVPRLQQLYRYASVAGGLPKQIIAGLMDRSNSSRFQRLGDFLRSHGGLSAAYWAMRGFFRPHEVSLLLKRYTGIKSYDKNCDIDAGAILEQVDPADSVFVMETSRYMRNQLLRDSDVMSMVWGLELRVPLVDHRLVDTISSIPSSLRLARGKQMLLDAVPEIPEWIRSQPKRGFRFPFERWISQSWGEVFQRLKETSPVPLNTWYRCWSLFTLEHFLEENRIESDLAISKNEPKTA